MKKLFLFSFLFLLTGGIKAQYIGMHFIGSSAQNMFCDSAYRHGYGFNMEFFSNNLLRKSVNPNALDLRFGLGVDFQGAGKEKRPVILSTPNSDPGKEILKNSHVGFNATMRLTFFGEKRVSPYLDGFIGLRGFYSHRELTIDKPDPDYETSTSEQVMSTGTTHYGASFGVMYRLNRVISVDTRVTYSDGSAGNWLNLNTVDQKDNIVSYRVSNTTTDLFIYRVGFVFDLNPKKKETSYVNPVQPVTPNDTLTQSDSISPVTPVTPVKPVETPKKKRNVDVTPSPTPAPAPTPKKPLEVKPLPPPAPKPKPKPLN